MEKLCNICPRQCNVDRVKNLGFCQATNKVYVSKVMLHFFEEPIISNKNGSGAIFFSNCSLKCVFCQNYEISTTGFGKEISVESLADIFKQLETAGANNINLVSPTHYTKQIINALNIYKPNIPIIWNTSGYEKPETIKLLKNYVDIYLTDLKYYDSKISEKLSKAKNYFEFASKSILEMRNNQPKDIIKNGIMQKGLIIRHLVLPNNTNDSLKIINYINDTLGNQTYISLMAQYVPMGKANMIPEINRKINNLEYKILVKKLQTLNFRNVFLQDFSSAEMCYTPDFNFQNPDFKY